MRGWKKLNLARKEKLPLGVNSRFQRSVFGRLFERVKNAFGSEKEKPVEWDKK